MNRIVVAAAAAAFAATFLPGASAIAQTNAGIPGVLNPATGQFATIPAMVPAASSVTIHGTVKLVLTLTIESAIGTDVNIGCSSSIGTFDASFANSASASVVAVRSGAKAVCTLIIPYEWTVAKAGETVTVTLSASTSNFSGGVSRSFSRTLAGFKLPTKSGETKTYTATGAM